MDIFTLLNIAYNLFLSNVQNNLKLKKLKVFN